MNLEVLKLGSQTKKRSSKVAALSEKSTTDRENMKRFLKARRSTKK